MSFPTPECDTLVDSCLWWDNCHFLQMANAKQHFSSKMRVWESRVTFSDRDHLDSWFRRDMTGGKKMSLKFHCHRRADAKRKQCVHQACCGNSMRRHIAVTFRSRSLVQMFCSPFTHLSSSAYRQLINFPLKIDHYLKSISNRAHLQAHARFVCLFF
jgi:hypothetical protein